MKKVSNLVQVACPKNDLKKEELIMVIKFQSQYIRELEKIIFGDGKVKP